MECAYRLSELANLLGQSQAGFCRLLDLTRSSFAMWKRGGYPELSTLMLISSRFKVSIDSVVAMAGTSRLEPSPDLALAQSKVKRAILQDAGNSSTSAERLSLAYGLLCKHCWTVEGITWYLYLRCSEDAWLAIERGQREPQQTQIDGAAFLLGWYGLKKAWVEWLRDGDAAALAGSPSSVAPQRPYEKGDPLPARLEEFRQHLRLSESEFAKLVARLGSAGGGNEVSSWDLCSIFGLSFEWITGLDDGDMWSPRVHALRRHLHRWLRDLPSDASYDLMHPGARVTVSYHELRKVAPWVTEDYAALVLGVGVEQFREVLADETYVTHYQWVRWGEWTGLPERWLGRGEKPPLQVLT